MFYQTSCQDLQPMFAEIRLEIYSHLLITRQWQPNSTEKQMIYIVTCDAIERVAGARRMWYSDFQFGLFPNLLRVCKKINSEATPVLYS